MLDATLSRIGYQGSREPSLEALRALQRCFLLSVPFENLDIHLGRELSLDSGHLFHKIVTRRRGGLCYECNSLFCDLLHAMGFEVTMLSARMRNDNGEFGPEYDHMSLRVRLHHDYLVDVGNGQSCREPLAMDGDDESCSEGIHYRLGTHEGSDALLVRQSEEAWHPRYLFSRQPRRRQDYGPMCAHTQSSPDSIFTQKRLVTLATPTGRITLSNRHLSVDMDGRKTERELGSDLEYEECLEHEFGIRL